MKAFCRVAIILLVCFKLPVTGQTQNWRWATGPIVSGTASAMCADVDGNSYVAGHFLGTLISGSDTLNDNLGPYQDIFVVKYGALGNALWATNAIGYADAQGITTDNTGNVYLVGDFYNDSLTFGSQVLTDAVHGNSNIFFTKYNSAGQVLWAKNLGGGTNNFAFGVCTDLSGNVYVTGYFTGDSMVLDNVVLQQAGLDNVFLIKFDSSGQVIWGRSESCTFIDGSNAVCTDPKGNVYITGFFATFEMDFGPDTLISPCYNNVFITKYDSLGNVQWAKYAGSNYGIGTTAIAADGQGNVAVTGYYSDTIIISGDTVSGPGYQNIFTAKYDTAGELLWAQSGGGTYVDQTNGVTCDESGNVYITGYVQSDTASFNNLSLINGTGNQLTFVTKYNAQGQGVWAVITNGASTNAAIGVAYSNGGIYVAGNLQGANMIFGNDTLAGPIIYMALLDTFIATDVIQLNHLAGAIVVYPNPSAGGFCFKGVEAGNRLEVYNLLGENVYSANISTDYAKVNLSGRAKGLYVYRVLNKLNEPVWQGKIEVE